MSVNKFHKKKVAVIVAAIFLLTLFALDMSALLVQGKTDAAEVQAASFKVKLLKGTMNPDGTYTCKAGGFNCLILVALDAEITIPLPF